MPIDKKRLEATARAFAKSMTSIRGRRVQRLVLLEFARFDHVLPATAEDGAPALFALGEDGNVAVCKTDGTGPAADVTATARLDTATVSTSYDLLKDSLPVLRWTVWHPGLARAAGALTNEAADVPRADQERVAALLRGVGS